MPKKPIDYSKIIMYKICCNDTNVTDIYINFTTELVRRKSYHKCIYNNFEHKNYNDILYETIRENGDWDNWKVIMIEEYPCGNINECESRLRYWIEQLKPTLNIKNKDADEKRKERMKKYYEEHKEEIALKKKEYVEKNKAKVYEKKKEYFEQNKEEIYRKANERIRCECCNVDVPRKHISTHNKSKKHEKNLSHIKVEVE